MTAAPLTPEALARRDAVILAFTPLADAAARKLQRTHGRMLKADRDELRALALARASGRSPNMLSETNSLILMSPTSGRRKSGTINAVGPKQVVWDGLTRKFKDKQPRSKFLKKRRHFVERPLVTK